MKAAILTLILVLGAGTLAIRDGVSAEPAAAADGLDLPAGTRQLLQEEMRELLLGTQAIAAALPVGDWDGIARTATAMRDSYVLERKLTAEQRSDLGRLPGPFQALDEAFHLRAGRLAQAAGTADAEAVSYQFSRLLEACTGCHSAYAKAQFPNFHPVAPAEHHH